MPPDVVKDSIVGSGSPPPVVFERKAVDRNNKSEPASVTPLEGNLPNRACYYLGMNSPPFQLWEELGNFPPAKQGFSSHDRKVKWPVAVNQRKDSPDELFPLKIVELR
jgi:hypothetical protein